MKDLFKDLFDNINTYRVMLIMVFMVLVISRCSTNREVSKLTEQVKLNNQKVDSLVVITSKLSANTDAVLHKVDNIENTTYQLAGSVSKINPHVNIRIKKDAE